MAVPRVVVVGGGFGGLQAVLGLKHAAVQVTLIDRRNHYLFQPLLYQVATGRPVAGEHLGPATGSSPLLNRPSARHGHRRNRLGLFRYASLCDSLLWTPLSGF
ncbi:MAG: FAD-dependent oxidoreductase [Planctomycetaceae bacterium]|nr:FAD-dependent oxidoreductase [Planctomycetaceae bacterium]